MQGDLQIDSEAGQGTRVRCTLRFKGIAAHDAPADATVASGLTTDRLSVLLIEDNPVNLEVGVAMLEQLGCEITVAHNGAEAVQHWRDARYDLVLMDCQLPRGSRLRRGRGPAPLAGRAL